MKLRLLALVAVVALILSCAVPALASVLVSFNNQNLYFLSMDVRVSDTDSDYMKVDRVYNSMSDFQHLFGYGWGSLLDTYLVVRPDGALQYHAYGGGQTTVLTPVPADIFSTAESARTIVAALEESGIIESSQESGLYDTLAEDDASYDRQDFYEKLLISGYLQPRETTLGEVFGGQMHGDIRIVRVEEGYEIFGPFEGVFDRLGRLTREWARGNPTEFVAYEYGTNAYDSSLNLIRRMRDYRGNVIRFAYDSAGHLTEVNGGRLGTVRYKYDATANLISKKDASGDEYRYTYDTDHDVTRIDFPHDKFQLFEYAQHDGRLTLLQCTDGSRVAFTLVRDSNGTITGMKVDETKPGAATSTQVYEKSKFGSYRYCLDDP